jgi:hypothetical protein
MEMMSAFEHHLPAKSLLGSFPRGKYSLVTFDIHVS